MFSSSIEDIIEVGKYFAFPQISLKPIRQRQDEKLTNDVIGLAKTKLRKRASNVVKDPLFFVGSVDFMVKNEDGRKTYYILEANGGNSRGFSAMPISRWQEANKCYAESLTFTGSDRPVVIVGHPNKDLLLHEKIVLAQHINKKLQTQQTNAEVIHVDNLTAKRLKQGNLVILGPYKNLLPRLSVYKNNYIYLDGKQVDVLIGDGIARRKPEAVESIRKKSLKTLVVNDVFLVTDDKALTYQAVNQAADILQHYKVEPIAYSAADNRSNLKKAISRVLNDIPEVLIKPHGGSGGSGIDIIHRKGDIDSKIEGSIKHFQDKFGINRDPFPYTVCQRVEATPIEWNDALHHFDIRIYVGRKEDKIIPLGALMRVALEPFSGRFTKKSFVVNLSGYEGVDTDRGFGLSKNSLKLFNLDTNDYAQMFAAACTITAFINNNYNTLIVHRSPFTDK